uniref:Zinc knuckle CX2CX4HX4C domain-containing protein n=1 Tax=Brassica oleracea var. oleracea TaxID=109376 RepID=A0A0D3BMA4_BRAOL
MRSSSHYISAHMADIKGKGIQYDDDEPILLTADDEGQLGKIASLQMIWGMPIIHGDYPSIIPFWVVMSGIPLHLWTVKNLKSIGGRLGHVDVDSIQVAEGRMLIDIDSRLPLKFTKKVQAPEGEEVTIQIKYEMLFKHCSTCGLLTHEKGYCPLTVHALVGTNQNVKSDVFARVQLPREQTNHQPSLGGYKTSNSQSQMSQEMRSRLDGYKESYATRDRSTDKKHGRESYHSRHGDEEYPSQHHNVKHHSDRIVRTRDDISYIYGNARSRYGPYDRKKELTWREKHRDEKSGKKENERLPHASNSIASSPRYEGNDATTEGDRNSYVNMTSKDGNEVTMHHRRKIVSTIVTPSRALVPSTENVTYRLQELACAISFSPTASVGKEHVMVIEALSGMDITAGQDGGAMESEIKDDDLLGLDLMEIEAARNQTNAAEETQEVGLALDRHKTKKSGTKRNAPLGVQSKKSQFLRRGSPAARSGRHSRAGQHGTSRKPRTSSS